MRLARHFFVEHDLRNPRPVAHVEKDQVAMVAPPVHPAHQDDVLASLFDTEIAAAIRPL
jgi:hypothetical protein